MNKIILLSIMLALLSACGTKTVSISYDPQDGIDGVDGYTSLIDVSRGDFEGCNGTIIHSGLDLNRNDILDSDEIKQTSFICDGKQITDNVINIINPCGDGPGHDEVILQVKDNDRYYYLAWLKNVGIVELVPGKQYITTDRQRCKFTLEDYI